MIQAIVLTIGYIISQILILFFIYHFQVSEYIFARFWSSLKERGIVKLVFPERFLLPAKSPRNFFIFSFGSSILIYYFVALFRSSIEVIIAGSIFGQVISVLAVTLGVIVTAPISYVKRRMIISQAIQKLAQSNAVIICISGSYGKTSTKEILFNILSSNFKVAKTDGNHNTDVGVAMSINKNLKPDTEFFIAEVGAYKKGDISKTVSYLNPEYAILTGIGNQHIDLFGSRQNILDAKKELLLALSETGTAYVNADSDNYDQLVKNLKCSIISYSIKSSKADVYAEEISIQGIRTSASIKCRKKTYKVSTKLLGRHNILNILPCIVFAHDKGVPETKILKSISALNPVYGRLSVHIGIKGITFLNDGYNSSLNGFLAALDVLDAIEADKKAVVSKGIYELGSEKKPSYEKVLKKMSEYNIQLITTDKLFGRLDYSEDVIICNTDIELMDHVIQNYRESDAVLVEGRFRANLLSQLGIEHE